MGSNEGYFGIGIDYCVMAQGMIDQLSEGYFPDPDILNGMASASEYGYKCAEKVINTIESNKYIAEQYLDMLDENIDFVWC